MRAACMVAAPPTAHTLAVLDLVVASPVCWAASAPCLSTRTPKAATLPSVATSGLQLPSTSRRPYSASTCARLRLPPHSSCRPLSALASPSQMCSPRTPYRPFTTATQHRGWLGPTPCPPRRAHKGIGPQGSATRGIPTLLVMGGAACKCRTPPCTEQQWHVVFLLPTAASLLRPMARLLLLLLPACLRTSRRLASAMQLPLSWT